MNIPTALLLGCLSFPVLSRVVDDEAVAASRAAALATHVEFLASDALAGRRAGSEGEKAAADYIISAFRNAGLQPVSESQGWLQDIAVRGHGVLDLRAVMHTEAGEVELLYGQDIRQLKLTPLEGRFGIKLAGSVDEFPEPSAEHVLLITGSDPGASWRLAAQLPEGGAGWACVLLAYGDDAGELASLPTHAASAAGDVPRLWLRGGALEALRSGRANSLELKIALSLGLAANNVLGVLPAAEGSATPEEWIVISAHYDHIGSLPVDPNNPDADVVFNGANDNAAGVAVMIELARAMAARDSGFARNVLFVAFTAEELGLLGSRFMAENSPVPLDNIVAVVNLEMLGEADPLLAGPGAMFLTGYELSDLGALLGAAADPRPRLNLFRRSDNAPFAELGVIAHTLSSGGENENYHQLSDEADTLDYEHMAKCFESALQGVSTLLNAESVPAWAEVEAEDSPSETR